MFRTRLVATLTAGIMAVGLTLSAAGAAVPTKTVPPKKWAQGVCLSLARFFISVRAHDFAVSQSNSQYELTLNLGSALDNTVDATKNVLRTLNRIGTPDAPKGEQTAAAFSKEFKKIKGVLAETSAFVFVLDITTDFEESLQVAQDDVTTAIDKGFAAMGAKTDPKVDKELEAAVACQTFSSD